MSSPAESSPEVPELVIEAGRSEAHYWRDLWRYRELLGFLAWRDVKVRYKQTYLGIAWALVQPLATTGVFTLIFGKLARMDQAVANYPLLVLAGMLPWQLFSAALSGSSASLVGNSHLISKVYFPRLVIPLSTLAVALVDFAVVLGLFLVVSTVQGIFPTWRWLLLPAMTLAALLVALGAGLWLTALTVKFRDFRYIVTFILQFGVLASPVGFPPDAAPSWATLLALNPMTGVIDGFRWCLLPAGAPFAFMRFAISLAIGLGLLAGGLWYFRRTERGFADII